MGGVEGKTRGDGVLVREEYCEGEREEEALVEEVEDQVREEAGPEKRGNRSKENI